MGTFKVIALYDFEGEPDSAELTIKAQEVLTVTRTDVGEGWWEGLNVLGKSGLFPQAYVERLPPDNKTSPPAMPAPVFNQAWEKKSSPTEDQDDWDDDWDNDDTYSEIGQGSVKQEGYYSNEPNHNVPVVPYMARDQMGGSNTQLDNKGTVSKKTLNRFSQIVKSGLESYLLGGPTSVPAPTPDIKIYREGTQSTWEPISNPYTVQINSPKKATKMGGLKSFIAYTLTPSFSNVEVSRRYKHFDWLHNRLTEKYNLLAVPPLPDKQISGRYEDQFIEHRRVQLQEFINYMCRHPVFSQSEVWHHFLTCTDEKQWKDGKRKAERDPFTGANFCLTVAAPEKELLTSDRKLDEETAYVIKLDQQIKKLLQTCGDQLGKCGNMYKRENMRIGESFFALGAAIDKNSKEPSQVSREIHNIGIVYTKIGTLFEEISRDHWQTLCDKLYIYKGITSCFPEIIHIQKQSESKKREIEKNATNPREVADLKKRCDTLTYTVFAEINHFQTEKNTDLRMAMKQFLQDQLKFYQNIVGQLQDTLDKFD